MAPAEFAATPPQPPTEPMPSERLARLGKPKLDAIVAERFAALVEKYEAIALGAGPDASAAMGKPLRVLVGAYLEVQTRAPASGEALLDCYLAYRLRAAMRAVLEGTTDG